MHTLPSIPTPMPQYKYHIAPHQFHALVQLSDALIPLLAGMCQALLCDCGEKAPQGEAAQDENEGMEQETDEQFLLTHARKQSSSACTCMQNLNDITHAHSAHSRSSMSLSSEPSTDSCSSSERRVCKYPVLCITAVRELQVGG